VRQFSQIICYYYYEKTAEYTEELRIQKRVSPAEPYVRYVRETKKLLLSTRQTIFPLP
jgi:hypothetical protein